MTISVLDVELLARKIVRVEAPMLLVAVNVMYGWCERCGDVDALSVLLLPPFCRPLNPEIHQCRCSSSHPWRRRLYGLSSPYFTPTPTSVTPILMAPQAHPQKIEVVTIIGVAIIS